MGEPALSEDRPIRRGSPSCRVPYFTQAGVRDDAGRRGLEFLASAMPMASASVDRLDQVPARLAFLFDYDAGRARWRTRRRATR